MFSAPGGAVCVIGGMNGSTGFFAGQAQGSETGGPAEPAVKISIANALRASSEYGVHDAEFLKGNIVEVQSGHYQLYYSPWVWTEAPEKQAITIQIDVMGYDMGARFKDFAPDAVRPCIRVQLPPEYFSDSETSGKSDHAEECGKNNFSFIYMVNRATGAGSDGLLMFYAHVTDRQGFVVAESDTLRLEYIELKSWRPPRMVRKERLEDDDGMVEDSWAEQRLDFGGEIGAEGEAEHGSRREAPRRSHRVAVCYLADAADVETMIANFSNWSSALGACRADCRHSPEDSGVRRGQGHCSAGSGGWVLHVFLPVEVAHEHQERRRPHTAVDPRRLGSSFADLYHTLAATCIPFQLHLLPASSPSTLPPTKLTGVPPTPTPSTAAPPADAVASQLRSEASKAAWPGARARLRRFGFFLYELLQHGAISEAQDILVLDPRLSFTRAVAWVDLDAGVAGKGAGASEWDVGCVYGGSDSGGAGGWEDVGPLQYNRGILNRSLTAFDAEARAACCAAVSGSAGGGEGGGAGEDSLPSYGGGTGASLHGDVRRDLREGIDRSESDAGKWCQGEALLRNVNCPRRLSEEDESGGSGRAARGRCEDGGAGVWNRVLHVGGSGAYYFRRHVYDNAAFRRFLHSSGAADEARSRMWTAEGVLTLWALLSVPTEKKKDLSFPKSNFFNVEHEVPLFLFTKIK